MMLLVPETHNLGYFRREVCLDVQMALRSDAMQLTASYLLHILIVTEVILCLTGM